MLSFISSFGGLFGLDVYWKFIITLLLLTSQARHLFVLDVCWRFDIILLLHEQQAGDSFVLNVCGKYGIIYHVKCKWVMYLFLIFDRNFV